MDEIYGRNKDKIDSLPVPRKQHEEKSNELHTLGTTGKCSFNSKARMEINEMQIDEKINTHTLQEEVDNNKQLSSEDDVVFVENGEVVVRNNKQFELRSPAGVSMKQIPISAIAQDNNQAGFFKRLLCGNWASLFLHHEHDDTIASPDEDFHADCFVKLSRGTTAYRFIEPSNTSEDQCKVKNTPTIVCLHGLTNSSYMWHELAGLLTDSDEGPKARVLVFDFYGRGRSPWNGEVQLSLDVLVTQLKELLDSKYLILALF